MCMQSVLEGCVEAISGERTAADGKDEVVASLSRLLPSDRVDVGGLASDLASGALTGRPAATAAIASSGARARSAGEVAAAAADAAGVEELDEPQDPDAAVGGPRRLATRAKLRQQYLLESEVRIDSAVRRGLRRRVSPRVCPFGKLKRAPDTPESPGAPFAAGACTPVHCRHAGGG